MPPCGGTDFAKIGPPWRIDFGKGDQFWQQKWSGGPVLAGFSAKIGPAGPILGGTDFGVTARPPLLLLYILEGKLPLQIYKKPGHARL